ncbi:MAG: endonuclease domain-containing protein [Chitinophagaceae bacterium]|nr:MAG: endonuclease domain-containing protein [Chitinophagaceae bacterium]
MKAPSDSPPKAEEPQSKPPLKEDADVTPGGPIEGAFFQQVDPTLYPLLKNFVAELRKHPTKAEDYLWQQLRGNKLDGYAFRRQHIIGRYIADFVCLAKGLVIEIDGLVHQLPENKANDAARTTWLTAKGYTVIRFTNDEVLFQTEATLEKIKTTLQQLPFLPKKDFIQKKASPQSEAGAEGSLPPLGEGPGMGAGSGDDYYLNEDGRVVFTANYLLSRGYCCGNGCRHCPYDYEAVPEPKRSALLEKRANLGGDK